MGLSKSIICLLSTLCLLKLIQGQGYTYQRPAKELELPGNLNQQTDNTDTVERVSSDFLASQGNVLNGQKRADSTNGQAEPTKQLTNSPSVSYGPPISEGYRQPNIQSPSTITQANFNDIPRQVQNIDNLGQFSASFSQNQKNAFKSFSQSSSTSTRGSLNVPTKFYGIPSEGPSSQNENFGQLGSTSALSTQTTLGSLTPASAQQSKNSLGSQTIPTSIHSLSRAYGIPSLQNYQQFSTTGPSTTQQSTFSLKNGNFVSQQNNEALVHNQGSTASAGSLSSAYGAPIHQNQEAFSSSVGLSTIHPTKFSGAPSQSGSSQSLNNLDQFKSNPAQGTKSSSATSTGGSTNSLSSYGTPAVQSYQEFSTTGPSTTQPSTFSLNNGHFASQQNNEGSLHNQGSTASAGTLSSAYGAPIRQNKQGFSNSVEPSQSGSFHSVSNLHQFKSNSAQGTKSSFATSTGGSTNSLSSAYGVPIKETQSSFPLSSQNVHQGTGNDQRNEKSVFNDISDGHQSLPSTTQAIDFSTPFSTPQAQQRNSYQQSQADSQIGSSGVSQPLQGQSNGQSTYSQQSTGGQAYASNGGYVY